MTEHDDAGSYRSETWFIVGALLSAFFVTMGLWGAVGGFNAAMLGFAALFAVFTISSASRSLHIDKER